MNQRNILVTGGFGFLGTHLVERLLTEPDSRVHVVDNLSTSFVDVDSFLARQNRDPRLTHDICSVVDFFREGRATTQFHEIYHLASVVGPVGVLHHGGQITRSIVEDSYLVMEAAMREKARLCDISTSEIYGGGRDGYCSENDSKIITSKVSVRLEYATAKLASEIAMVNMARVSDLDVVIVRPFNIAGPRQSGKGGFVLPRFIQQALANEPITVYGDGSMVRAFTHVVDMVEGIVRTARVGKRGEPYNIGNPANKISILELAQRVVALCESKSRIDLVDPKKLFGPLFEEANDKYPDADKAAKDLDWHAKYDLDTVIRHSVEYIRAGRRD
jgi:nucleoside-diphosphate-sugar epimerase